MRVPMTVSNECLDRDMEMNQRDLVYGMQLDSVIRNVICNNYNDLNDKPSLNGVTIEGAKISEDYYLPKVLFDTTANWATRGTEVSERNTVYVYVDYQTVDGYNVAGIKVGDGLAYITDLPFTDTLMQRHIQDTTIHITQAEREFWNNKERSMIYGENLILTKE